MLILLCCHDRANTNNIVIYNLQTEGEVKQIGLSGSSRKNYYQWGDTLELIWSLTNKDYGFYWATPKETATN